MNPSIVMTLLVVLLFALGLYAWFVPRNQYTFAPKNDEVTSKNPFLRASLVIGRELYATLPAGMVKDPNRKSFDPRIQSLIVRSGNPWKLTANEFVAFRYISGFMGFIAAWPIWLLISQIMPIVPVWFLVPAITIFAFFIPTIKYKEQAKQRDTDFKRELPEALELIMVGMEAGRTFNQSIRDSIPLLKEGVVKQEFKNIVTSMDSGNTLHDALDEFADRAPNDTIVTFIRSIQSADESSSGMNEALSARAQASRQELFALIQEMTGQLSDRISMVLSPTLLPAVIIIAVAQPAASFLHNFVGS